MRLIDFVKRALTHKSNIQEKYSLGFITAEQAEQIQKATGLHVKGYERIIDNFGVLHTLNWHGNEKTEAKRGQIHVTEYDFEKISEITAAPDHIRNMGKSQRGGIVIQYEKRSGELYFYNEEVRKKRKQLALKTIYKRKL